MLEHLIKEMKDSIKKGLLNYPNSKEVERLKDEWDRVINNAKRTKLNPEFSTIKTSATESVSLKKEGNLQNKVNFGHQERKQDFNEVPSFDLGFDFSSHPVEEVTLCKSLEKVNLTPPEEKPKPNKTEIVSLLTPPEQNPVEETNEIQASLEEFNAANALFSMSKNPL